MCVIFNRYVPVGLANSCYNKDATPFPFSILFNTGKARKGSSNYESNDIADDDPENAKGEFCRSHFQNREQWKNSGPLLKSDLNETYYFWSTPITISIQIPTKKQKILRVFHRFP